MMSIPPTKATKTYKMFPMLPIIGIRMFAKRFAAVAFLQRSSFMRSKSSTLCSSWQNTLTTFCPFIISSTKPSVAAIERCMAIKFFALFAPTFFATSTIATLAQATTSAIHTLR